MIQLETIWNTPVCNTSAPPDRNISLTGCGFGVCDSSGTFCICDDGYRHDTIYTYNMDCRFNDTMYGWICIILCTWSIPIFLNGLYNINRSKKQARQIMIIATIAEFCIPLYLVSLYLEDYRIGYVSATLSIIIDIGLYGICLSITLYAMLEPLYAFSRHNLSIVVNLLEFNTAFIVVTSITMHYSIARYRDDRNMHDILTIIHLIINTLHNTFIAIFATVCYFNLKREFKSIGSKLSVVSTTRPSNLNKSKSNYHRNENKLHEYLVRVRYMNITFFILGCTYISFSYVFIESLFILQIMNAYVWTGFIIIKFQYVIFGFGYICFANISLRMGRRRAETSHSTNNSAHRSSIITTRK